MAITAFYKRRRNHMQSALSPNRGQYLRLMAISGFEIKIIQVAGFTWKNDPEVATSLEMFRWSLVACAFLFFALFGFAGEAREHYYRLYMSLARRIGKSTSTPYGAPHGYVVRLKCYCPDSLRLILFVFCSTPSVSYVKRTGGVVDPIVVQIGLDKDNLSVSISDQSSVPSTSMESTLNQDSMTLQDSNSDTVSFYTAESSDEPGTQDERQLAPPPAILPSVRPAPVSPQFPNASESTMPVHPSCSVETV